MNGWEGFGQAGARGRNRFEGSGLRNVGGAAEELANLGIGYYGELGATSTTNPRQNSVEIVLVKAAHQPFGLLMTQVYNIVRPTSEGIRVQQWPDPHNGRPWAEIDYNGGRLRVLELAAMLQMPLVEPIDRSKIVLTGQMKPDGSLDSPFGLAVDDVIAVRGVALDNLRLMPGWLCQKRLGRLIWGMALLDRESLAQEETGAFLTPVNLLTPVQLSDFMSEAVSFENNAYNSGSNSRWATPNGPTSLPVQSEPDLNRFGSTVPGEVPTLRPVMLINLEMLKKVAYDNN